MLFASALIHPTCVITATVGNHKVTALVTSQTHADQSYQATSCHWNYEMSYYDSAINLLQLLPMAWLVLIRGNLFYFKELLY